MRRRVLLQMYLRMVPIAPNKRGVRWIHWTECPLDRAMVQELMQWWLVRQSPCLHAYATAYCWYCGIQPGVSVPTLLYDHAFPADYATTPLVLCCLYCNSSKNSRSPQAFRRCPRLRKWDGVFWFERIGLQDSPLGMAVREDKSGFHRLFARYLNERNTQEAYYD